MRVWITKSPRACLTSKVFNKTRHVYNNVVVVPASPLFQRTVSPYHITSRFHCHLSLLRSHIIIALISQHVFSFIPPTNLHHDSSHLTPQKHLQTQKLSYGVYPRYHGSSIKRKCSTSAPPRDVAINDERFRKITKNSTRASYRNETNRARPAVQLL